MQRPNTTAISQRLKCETVRSLEDAARDFSDRLPRYFSQEIARNPRDFKKQVLRLMRQGLPPRRRRPGSPQNRSCARNAAPRKDRARDPAGADSRL